jgi:hypothetical protein
MDEYMKMGLTVMELISIEISMFILVDSEEEA